MPGRRADWLSQCLQRQRAAWRAVATMRVEWTSALAMGSASTSPMATSTADGDRAMGSDRRDAGSVDRGIRTRVAHHMPPIDQHRRRDPCLRFRRVRGADNRAQVPGAIIGGCDYSGLRPRMMRTNTTTTAMTRRICMKPPKVYEDT